MKKIITLIFVFAVAAAMSFAQADPVEGFWLSIDEDDQITAGWQIFQENGVLFGRILSSTLEPEGTLAYRMRDSYRGFPLAGRVNEMPLAGPPWIFGLSRHGTGDWRGGNIIDPLDGRMYSSRITFRPAGTSAGRRNFAVDTLEMRGHIGPFGRSQFWTRTDEATAASLWLVN
ncbi:MAG: DUF2147 domain-containing protein [Treponema sp.]|jgi:uncharacterized protein (DUF2147 family)|nr:DUF2147 domain-containing protein [Treponema sp.]